MADDRRGRDGLQGPRGKAGPEGARGVAGPIGPEGPPGPQGRDGVLGPEGPTGPKGVDGQQGPPGKPGIAGAPGVAGAAGPQGNRGPQGVAGPLGPMPRHEWQGTSLRFEIAPNQWGALVDLQGPAGKNGQTFYGAVPDAGSSGIPDAPIDGSVYGRQDGGWVVVSGGGGSAAWGTITGTLGNQTDLANALAAKAATADLGSAAFEDTTAFATAAQGATADSAVQPGDLATVATTGAYSDLSGKPTLGTAAAHATGDFATAAQGATADSAVQPGDLATVATTGAYSDLTGKPSLAFIPTTADITAIVKITQSAYDALSPPSSTTLYVIIG